MKPMAIIGVKSNPYDCIAERRWGCCWLVVIRDIQTVTNSLDNR